MNVFIEGGEIVVLRIDELGVNVVNDSRTKNCNQVSREHNLVGTESGDSDGFSLDFGSDEPADEGENESGPGGDDGSGTGGFGPGHHVPEGDDGGSDDDSHEEVDPAEIQSHGVQCDLCNGLKGRNQGAGQCAKKKEKDNNDNQHSQRKVP
mmetsp:Transcript_1147/g.2457  ORF Transcript_1147/g.2457 Transcript_1147/m.2457 type:complete len:151 (-) Transcript_1147:201-653(-)